MVEEEPMARVGFVEAKSACTSSLTIEASGTCMALALPPACDLPVASVACPLLT